MQSKLSHRAQAFCIDNLLGVRAATPQKPASPKSNEDTAEDAPKICCRLEQPDLWTNFSAIGTEMIITKAGRRLFPSLQVRFSNSATSPPKNNQGNDRLLVAFDVVPASNRRFRYSYSDSNWIAAGTSGASRGSRKRQLDNPSEESTVAALQCEPKASQLFVHPDSPISWSQLVEVDRVFSFERVKLVNDSKSKRSRRDDSTVGQHKERDHNNEKFLLTSMHQYQPRIHLILLGGGDGKQPTAYWTFAFPETRFMAVTAYQNQLITRLKIDANPFAKGFRQASRFSMAQAHLAYSSTLVGIELEMARSMIVLSAASCSYRQSGQKSDSQQVNEEH